MFIIKNFIKYSYWVQYNFSTFLKKILNNSIKKLKIKNLIIEIKASKFSLNKLLKFFNFHSFCKFNNLVDLIIYVLKL